MSNIPTRSCRIHKPVTCASPLACKFCLHDANNWCRVEDTCQNSRRSSAELSATLVVAELFGGKTASIRTHVTVLWLTFCSTYCACGVRCFIVSLFIAVTMWGRSAVGDWIKKFRLKLTGNVVSPQCQLHSVRRPTAIWIWFEEKKKRKLI